VKTSFSTGEYTDKINLIASNGQLKRSAAIDNDGTGYISSKSIPSGLYFVGNNRLGWNKVIIKSVNR
ncbi:MAG TPA: hypothetical protein VHO70_06780, partial [Chitinispirillaceae bacterium]|nr:hypothetical protein [Chitinispirillaceae bacterium]